MGESSPDLSLRLRRGSSDSRDSFYMDFAQGIDSDIEEVTRPTENLDELLAESMDNDNDAMLPVVSEDIATIPEEASEELRLEEEQDALEAARREAAAATAAAKKEAEKDKLTMDWPGLPATLPSPASPSAVIVSPETLSRHSSSSPTRGSGGGVVGTGCGGGTTGSTNSTERALNNTGTTSQASNYQQQHHLQHHHHHDHHSQHHHQSQMGNDALKSDLNSQQSQPLLPQYALALCQNQQQQSMIPAVCYPVPNYLELEVTTDRHYKHSGCDAFSTTLSALYGKLLVVMGIAFPMAEVISTYIPPSFYEAFYLYLYIGSMLFLVIMYLVTCTCCKSKNKNQKEVDLDSSQSSSGLGADSDSPERGGGGDVGIVVGSLGQLQHKPAQHYGSFYLRMGAVAFGVGSMIYSGLEFGQYFELERNTKCHNIMLALTPATRMAFIFIQMYFIFLNDKQMKVYSHRMLSRFGLMHMIGTNLSVWLNVLIQETKHEILTFYNPENNTLRISHRLGTKAGHIHLNSGGTGGGHVHHVAAEHHSRLPRGLKGPHHMFECRRTNIMGSLVQDASPFLFPCTIEYSLICAAILYVMWKNICKTSPSSKPRTPPAAAAAAAAARHHSHAYRRSPHHYSVDCAGAHKGLFLGILILVLTIISLILFFVLTSRPELVSLAVTEVNICELTLYGMSTLATLVGMCRMRKLRYDGSRNLELDNILLVGAQTGMFIYSTFTIIGSHFTLEKHTVLVLITALASVVQTTCQTIFILDASRRSVSTADHMKRKPGREIVTFLLVTNLAMWAINTLEKSRAESHPVQLHFYGLWAWTIITHVSMPLAIFYRFHSTVCLCEIWKKAYKVKPTYM
ncbi:hypothetical protein TKK_0002787 [Trichogramma kaykai]|uniref:Otopetrin-2 n=1 Tax=Trichogramma kaykai TaxID=54128 RepID=A0ABD2XR06_9HYME